MATQEKELHTKFRLLLSGQGYVEGGVIYVTQWDAAPKKKYLPFHKLFTTHTLLSLFTGIQSKKG